MNLLTYPHTIPSLFILSWKLFQKNLIPILMLTALLLALPLVVGMGGWFETESVVFFVMVHVLEAAITLGIIGLSFGSYFPTIGVLKALQSPLILGAIHIGILQYLLFITGVMGLTLPFPFSVLIVAMWLGGLLLTTLAQPVFMAEGLRGMRAMVRSIQMCRADLGRVFTVVIISTIMQFVLFAILFTVFLPDLDLNVDQNHPELLTARLTEIMSDPGVHLAIRWAQYVASIVFYPFASILTTLLYFDLTQRQGGVNVDRLAQYSNHLFGTALGNGASPTNPASAPADAGAGDKTAASIKDEVADEKADVSINKDNITKISEVVEIEKDKQSKNDETKTKINNVGENPIISAEKITVMDEEKPAMDSTEKAKDTIEKFPSNEKDK